MHINIYIYIIYIYIYMYIYIYIYICRFLLPLQLIVACLIQLPRSTTLRQVIQVLGHAIPSRRMAYESEHMLNQGHLQNLLSPKKKYLEIPILLQFVCQQISICIYICIYYIIIEE